MKPQVVVFFTNLHFPDQSGPSDRMETENKTLPGNFPATSQVESARRWTNGSKNRNKNSTNEGKCSSSCQCSWREVGCSSDSDCQSGLNCKRRPKLGNRCLNKPTNDDDNNNDNRHTYPSGHGKYCSNSCPCKEGEGDCDSDEGHVAIRASSKSSWNYKFCGSNNSCVIDYLR